MAANLHALLGEGRTHVHEPAFAPDHDAYVSWDYARGYTDAVQSPPSTADPSDRPTSVPADRADCTVRTFRARRRHLFAARSLNQAGDRDRGRSRRMVLGGRRWPRFDGSRPRVRATGTGRSQAACRGLDTSNFYHPENERGPSRARRETQAKADLRGLPGHRRTACAGRSPPASRTACGAGCPPRSARRCWPSAAPDPTSFREARGGHGPEGTPRPRGVIDRGAWRVVLCAGAVLSGRARPGRACGRARGRARGRPRARPASRRSRSAW